MKLRFIILCIILQPLFAVWLTHDQAINNSPFKFASLGKIEKVPGRDAFLFRGKGENSRSWYTVSIPDMDTSRLIDGESLYFEGKILNVNDLYISESGDKVLIQTNREKIWRYSHWGSYHIYDLKESRLSTVSQNHHRLRNVKFSPNGQFVAYVREDNNLYTFEIDKERERKLTNSGSETILNGHFGWLYEEELTGYDAYRWSPDSRYIAFWQEDQSLVKEYSIIDEMEVYPIVQKIRYPKAGETNPIVKIGIVRSKGGGRKWIDIGKIRDHYIPWMEWANNDRIAYLKMDRKQKNWDLVISEKETGKSFKVLHESDPDGWLDNHGQFRFLKDGRIIWISENSGYKHIHMAKHSGSRTWPVTSGEWEVTEINYIDEDNGLIYFTSNKESVFEKRFYVIRFDGTNLRLLTPEDGSHSVIITSLGNYFIDTYSSLKMPKRILLKNLQSGKLLNILDETDLAQFNEYEWSYPKIVHFPTIDRSEILDGMIILPTDYDPKNKYPVIIHGYGMPGTQFVWNQWGRTLHQYFAQLGFIVFAMDTRGMSGRGEKYKNLSYGNMAHYLAKDQLAGIKYLIDGNYADPERIGALGWSGGGYFTCLMMTKNGSYFKAGVAISPCTDFRLYDTAYTERSMGLPQENVSGYDSTNTITWINRMTGSLLLMHGTSDDNVHSQHTSHFVQSALNSGKDVEWYQYPGRNHGIYGGGAREHLYKKLIDFFKENL